MEERRNMTDIRFGFCVPIFAFPGVALFRTPGYAALAPADQAPGPDLRAWLAGATDELPVALTETWICGTPDEAEQRIREYASARITHFMLWFVDAPRLDGMQLFAKQIAPRFHRRE
jgi:alkanesulfonate monooxygenase SsuD/methylene tetrahydromethanopterin reductase-like flavin-dependent oxidoreductase (luciferase family)